jgi:hypothetical protein
MGKPVSKIRLLVLCCLPVLHALACVATALLNPDTGWKTVSIIDYPVSLVAVGLTMTHDISPFLVFVFIGTTWWALLGRVLVFVADRVHAFRKPTTQI